MQPSCFASPEPSAPLLNDRGVAGFRRGVVRLRVRRKTSATHIAAILARGAQDFLSDLRVSPRKLRRLAKRQTDHVVQDKDRAIAGGPRPEPEDGIEELRRTLHCKC